MPQVSIIGFRTERGLYQFLLLEVAEDDKMKAWLQKKQYLSPVITNEMINIMGKPVLESILTNIKTSKWYAIIVDEATDVHIFNYIWCYSIFSYQYLKRYSRNFIHQSFLFNLV